MKCCGILVLAIVPLFVTAQQIYTVEVGKTKYFVSNQSPYSPKLNWFLAYQYCRNIGMELLTMPREEEANELISYLGTNGFKNTGYWTSGNRLGSEMWIWMTTGHPFNSTFNFWAQQVPPSKSSGNSCTALTRGQWESRPCTEAKAFVCQLTRCYYFNYVVSHPSTQGNTTTSRTPPTKRSPLHKYHPIRRTSQTVTQKTVSKRTYENEVEPRKFIGGARRQFNNYSQLTNSTSDEHILETPGAKYFQSLGTPQMRGLRRKETFSWAFANDY